MMVCSWILDLLWVTPLSVDAAAHYYPGQLQKLFVVTAGEVDIVFGFQSDVDEQEKIFYLMLVWWKEVWQLDVSKIKGVPGVLENLEEG